MEDKDRYIEELLALFFEGRTTNVQEKELYDYFAQANVPERLVPYKPLISYFENGLEKNLAIPKSPPKNIFRHIGVRASVAAVFILGALIALPFLMQRERAFDPYQGSYIVRNGQMVPGSPETFASQREAIERDMDEKQRELDAISDAVDRKIAGYTSLNETERSLNETAEKMELYSRWEQEFKAADQAAGQTKSPIKQKHKS